MTAEYSKPHGNKAHTKPNTKGAANRARAAWCCPRGLMRRQMPWVQAPNQDGGSAPQTNHKPNNIINTWKKLQAGLNAALWTVSHPKPCMDAAANAPKPQ
jgi:hypothetical protein